MSDKNPTPLTPCRRKINGKAVKKALAAFVGACGAATVMTAALNSTPLAAQPKPPASEPAGVNMRLEGDVAVIRIATSGPTSGPAATSRPTTRRSATMPRVISGPDIEQIDRGVEHAQ